MTIRALLRSLCVVLLFLSAARSVQADAGSGQSATIDDVATSHEHFNRGVEYVHDGDLRGALIEFKRAYAVSPNYRVLFNLGQVANALGRYTEAQDYFQHYINDGQDEIPPDRKRDVEAQLGKLAGRIATLVLATNVPGAEIFVDDVSVGTSPLQGPVKVSSGTGTIAAISSGRPRVSQVIDVAGGDTVALQLSFPAASEAGASSASQSLASAPLVPARATGSSAAGSPVLWLGITSGALLVGAGVMGYLTVRDAQQYDDAVARKTSVRELEDLDSRASTKALVTDVLLGATVVAAGITVLVALSGSGERERLTRAKPAVETGTQVSLGVGSLQLNSTF
jgi:tetratricopeptide (TPR) repeat protein